MLPGALHARAREWGPPLVASLWLTLIFLLRWPPLSQPGFVSESALDSALFAYAGELVRTGGTPYLTFWDHKAPLIFLVNAAALALSGGKVWGLWLLNLGVFVGATVLGHACMRRAFGPLAALLGTTCFASSLAAMMPANLTEGYVLPLQWAAVLLLVGWAAERPAPFMRGAALGVLAALAFFLRANLIGAALSVGLTLVAMMVFQRRSRDCMALVLGGVAGIAIVSLMLVAYLASAGALSAFWEQAFEYNFVYARSELRSRVGAAFFGTMLVTRFGSAVIPFAGWVMCARRVWSARRGMQTHPVYLLALVWLPIELLLASMSGRHYGHYFATALAPLALLSAAFVAEALAMAPAAQARGNGVLMVRLLAGGTALIAIAATTMQLVGGGGKAERERRAQVTAAADYVRAKTGAGAPLLVWGHAADVHFFSGRRPASRFVYPLPLLTPGYANAARVNSFLDEIRTAAPPLIIDATANAQEGEDLVPSLARWDPTWGYPRSPHTANRWWSMTPELKAFYDYVHANYEMVDTVGPKEWVVYKRLPVHP
jgi:hypothetical protein